MFPVQKSITKTNKYYNNENISTCGYIVILSTYTFRLRKVYDVWLFYASFTLRLLPFIKSFTEHYTPSSFSQWIFVKTTLISRESFNTAVVCCQIVLGWRPLSEEIYNSNQSLSKNQTHACTLCHGGISPHIIGCITLSSTGALASKCFLEIITGP